MKCPDINIIPPLTGKPEQRRFTTRCGVLTSNSSRQRSAISGRPCPNERTLDPQSAARQTQLYIRVLLPDFTMNSAALHFVTNNNTAIHKLEPKWRRGLVYCTDLDHGCFPLKFKYRLLFIRLWKQTESKLTEKLQGCLKMIVPLRVIGEGRSGQIVGFHRQQWLNATHTARPQH